MSTRQRQRFRRRLPGHRGPSAPARNTLASSQLPSFASEPLPRQTPSPSITFRVPSPTTSDEEDIQAAEAGPPRDYLPEYLDRRTSHPLDFDFSEGNRDSLSVLGDSSSLFSDTGAIDLLAPAPSTSLQPFQFGTAGPTSRIPFFPDSAPNSKMVVEREPPKATPQKPVQPPSFVTANQPQFGQPSPLQNRLQPSYVFNIPKPNQPRSEHHRQQPPAIATHLQQVKDFAHKVVEPFRTHHPIQPRSTSADPDVVEIPRPINAAPWNAFSRPPATYSSINPPGGVAAPITYQKPVIDLTQPQVPYRDPALSDAAFGAIDPYNYIDAAKANENIKALLEGAFEDEEDKPRSRNRKKRVEATVADLSEKLKEVNVKGDSDKENEDDQAHDDEDEDDGTVEGLNVKLLPHQVDGVAWMTEKEIGTKKKNNGILPKGGILADDMGLGKTIQSIALMLTNPRPALTTATSVADKKTLSSTVGKGTLVVAPLALIKQWEGEIKNRVNESHKLRVCIHHGPQRTKRFEDLKKYDVVITTYQILVSEHGSSSQREDGPKVGCFGIHWYRVILDEAHTIKNRNAKATQACYTLRSEYRWCLTGTPMQNNLDELQSLIKFLRIKPYNDLAIWKEQITKPLSQGRGGIAIKRLQFYLKAFMKRRTKDVLKLEGALNPGGKPSKDGQNNGFKITARKVESVLAEFSPEERSFYDRLEQRTDRSLEQMMGGQKMNYASALVLLLRLRQACNHPELVGGSMAKDRDALTTGSTSGTQTPRKSKVADDEIDAMADLLGGMSVKTKQCDVCQIELSQVEVSCGAIRCTECEGDLASQRGKKGKHKGRKETNGHLPAVKAKPETFKPRAPKNRRVILDDSEDEDAEWVVPENERHVPSLGKAGGSDDENAEGGGESLGSDDSDTEDESSVQVVKSQQRKVINLDTTDEEAVEVEEEDEESSSSESDDPSLSSSITSSAKIRHLLTILHRESSTHKFIVFSQFTSMLDLIEPFLKRDNLSFTRYDGSMRNDLREASLDRLRNNSKTRILLCSLKCGSLGLNLTAASRVVILEPFWNPFVEEQAIDRVHRLNQTRDVVVYKLTIANTVEARILDLQEKKRALAKAAIGGDGKAAAKLSMKDMLDLFKRDAEHDLRHAGDVELGTMTRVLENNVGRDVDDVAGYSRRKAPAVGRAPVKEHDVYGRRWE